MSDNPEIYDYAVKFARDPLSWAYFAFPWGSGELERSKGPRKWQKEMLEHIRDHLNSDTRFQPLLMAVASGHGIGKSAAISMILQWGMSTCLDCRAVVTANTENQLRTKTWPEISKWFRLAINKKWFNVTATSIYSIDSEREKSWRCDAIPWTKERSEAFAGLHNEGKRIIVIMDEGSAIDDKIYEVVEGALTDENTEILWIVFGNPTRNTGRFKACFGRFRNRWFTRKIDSRDVEGTNKEQIQKWLEDHGEDSDFFRVRVRGEFPSQSTNQLIPEDDVDRCGALELGGYQEFPIRITCDVARFGEDSTVIMALQGRKLVDFMHWNGKDTVQTATKLIEMYNYWKKKQDRITIYVDDDGVGGGVTDMLRASRMPVIPVNSGSSPEDKELHTNKRMEMWWRMAQALKEGLDLTFIKGNDFERLKDDLISIEYTMNPTTQRYQLEGVKSLKERGLPSPDYATALALSFAYPVPNVLNSEVTKVKNANSGSNTLRRKRGK